MIRHRKLLLFFGLVSLLVSLAWLSFGKFAVSHSVAGEMTPARLMLAEKATAEPVRLAVTSFITPHHLMAKQMIEDIFEEVAKKNGDAGAERIVLISPDHFQAGRNLVSVREQAWRVGSDTVANDPELVSKLIGQKLAVGANDSFDGDHGIRDLIPFVREYFPGVPVVALLVPENLSADEADGLVNLISDGSDGKTLLILSSDFSHYLDENLARLHDQRAIAAISDFDFEAVYNLETDCPAGLYLLLKFSEAQGYSEFKLKERSSASVLAGRNRSVDNTSYVTGHFKKGEKKKSLTASLLFAGDLMLDRDVRSLIDRKGTRWLTEKIERIFWGQDVNVANLEGPVTFNRTVSQGTAEDERSHFLFTFDPASSRRFLQENRMDLVALGNNHSLNFGSEGLAETEKNLQAAGTDFFGDPEDEKNFYVMKDIGGRKVAFLNYNQFGRWPLEKYLKKIQLAKKDSDRVIVYAHWGTEYETRENESQRQKAHAFIEAGADLVIGSHPHVVQPVEIYQGKAIFYSLGNFIFDQYFSEPVRERLLVGAQVADHSFEFVLVPVYLEKNGQLVQMDPSRRAAFLARLAGDSRVEEKIRTGIMEGTFKIND